MWCTGEKCCRDRDDRPWSFFILATVVNASVDGGGGRGRTGGVGSLASRHSIGFAADRSACSLVHEMKEVQEVMLIVQNVV